MDAVNFVKEYNRMCNKYDGCQGCPLDGKDCEIVSKKINADHIVNVVEKWSKEHPQKTMMQDFFEKHPNAPRDKDGFPTICPYECGYTKDTFCPEESFGKGCSLCWNRPIGE